MRLCAAVLLNLTVNRCLLLVASFARCLKCGEASVRPLNPPRPSPLPDGCDAVAETSPARCSPALTVALTKEEERHALNQGREVSVHLTDHGQAAELEEEAVPLLTRSAFQLRTPARSHDFSHVEDADDHGDAAAWVAVSGVNFPSVSAPT